MICICLEGTWSPEPWGILGDVVSRISVPVVRVRYPEEYGKSFSYAESVYIGKRALRRRIEQIKDHFVIVCYSQGAHIAGDVAYEYRDDPRFLAIYLIADPKRSPADEVVGDSPGGKGIFGSRRVGPKAKHIVAKGDIISACDNPFISNVAQYTTERKNGNFKDWLYGFKEVGSRRQPGGKILRAVQEVKYYLKSGVHSKYNEMELFPGTTATRWIAEDIERINNERTEDTKQPPEDPLFLAALRS